MSKARLISFLNKYSQLPVGHSPLIFHLSKTGDRQKVLRLFQQNKISQVRDYINEQEAELELINNPGSLNEEKSHRREFSRGKLRLEEGVWVYYPWQKSLVHCLDNKKFNQIRLSRNHNLITPVEQKKLSQATIGIAGLNVGNPAAICLALEGIGKLVKLADNDVLSLSNLNRFRAGLADVGINKAVLTARQVYEINPFIKLRLYSDGIKSGQERMFFTEPKIDILIEEVDNLPLKLSLRSEAKKMLVPVVMVTGNGANVIVDVERYDLNPNLKILNGHLKRTVVEDIGRWQLDFKSKVLLARDFIGQKYLVDRLQKSFSLVGKSLAGIPQLAEASFLRGAVLGFFVRQIILKKTVPSGRYFVKMDKIIK